MGSLLEGLQALHYKFSMSLILATATFAFSTVAISAVAFAEEQNETSWAKPLHRESKMVAVDWYSTPPGLSANELPDSGLQDSTIQDEASRLSVAKPIVDEAVEHTVYQSPSVYLDSPQNRSNSNTIFDGFKQAGQNLSQATGQTLQDLGNGTKNVAQGIYDGTANTIGAGATAVDNTVDNTFNMGNQQYFNERSQQNSASQNRPDLPPPPVNRQTAAYQDDLNNQGFATTQGTNGQFNDQQFNNVQNSNAQNSNQQNTNPPQGYNNQQYSQQQYSQQANQQQNETPAVPRRPLGSDSGSGSGIATNFGNNQSGRNYNADDSQMTPVQDRQQNNFANNGSANNGYGNTNYPNQNPYQNNSGPNNQITNPNYNQNRPNLITPPAIDQYAAGNSQSPAWSTPSFPGQTTQQAARPISPVSNPWPQQNETSTGWGEGQNGPTQTTQQNNNQVAQTNSNQPNTTIPNTNGNLVWILAGFSLFGNVYGWTALLEMRNKYRASLRRSPTNLRDGGH